MTLININDQIEALSTDAENTELITYLKEIREANKVETYLQQDADNFSDADSYVDLINEIATLTNINVDNVSYNISERWNFNCTLNNYPASISISPSSDNISEEFLEQLNKEMEYAGFSGKICCKENSEQNISMLFIEQAELNKA